MTDKDKEPTVCPVCNRLHEQHQPCPKRIANALTCTTIPTQQQALLKLTDADTRWLADHKDFSILDIIEDAIVDTFPQGGHIPM